MPINPSETQAGGLSRLLARRWHWALALVIVLGVAARVAVLARGSGLPADPDNYLPLARSLAAGQGLSFNGRATAYRPPLYPLVLAALVLKGEEGLAGRLAALHVVLGAGAVALTALTARRWGLSPGRALAAAAIVACDPVLVVQIRSVMTETLAAFLVALTLWAVALEGRRGAIVGGVCFGLSALCRPSLLPGAGLAGLALVCSGTGRRTARFGQALLLVTGTLVVLAPWAWRNARLFGEPVWTTTHGGYTLYLANNPIYYEEVLHGAPGAVWSGPSQLRWIEAVQTATAGARSQPEADRRLRDQAIRVILARPADFLRATLARLGRFWGIAPAAAVYPRALRLATAVWSVPLLLGLVLGLFSRTLWSWPRIAAPAAIVALTAVHAVYWTDLRMRAPLVPAIALVASAAGGAGQRRESPLPGPLATPQTPPL